MPCKSTDFSIGYLEVQNSTHTLRCAIAARDKKLAVLSEKIHAHLLLFDSIEKETAAVKQVLDRVQDLVNEKEHVGM